MQKNYRDYTVGELLDMGFDIDVYNHQHPSRAEAYAILSQLEGLKQSSYTLTSGINVVRGWNSGFNISNFLGE